MTITVTEQIGTTGDDVFTGTTLTGSIGLAGNDTFTSVAGAQITGFAGGDGSDTYTIGIGSTALIYDDGRSGTDMLTISGIDYLNSVFGIIDGRHLFAYDLTTSTAIYGIDWVSGYGADNYSLDGTLVSDAFLRANLTVAPNFAGYYTWDDPEVGFGFTGTEIRDAIDLYQDRVQDEQALSEISDGSSTIYRFYNTSSGNHFYTASADEARFVATDLDAFAFEGAAFGAGDDDGAQDVYRFYNASSNAHFYTMSADERDFVINTLPSFQYEGVAYQAYADAADGRDALYRFYNEATGSHFYTTSEGERDYVIDTISTMNYEGVAYYVDGIS